MSNQQALAQLRHAYKQLIEGVVKDQAQFAKGLIGPVIEHLEKTQQSVDSVGMKAALVEVKSYLRTLANFGGTLQQAKELAQKCLDKLDTK